MTQLTLPRPQARLRLPPGPRGHWLLGNLPAMRADMLGFYRQLGRDYGDIVRVRFAGVDTFALFHPDFFKHVLQDHNRNYVRNKFLNRILKLFIGESLFTTDGEAWRSRRRLMQPAFHRQRIAGFGTLMTGATQAMLAEWHAQPEGARLWVDQELMRLTLRVAGQALFSADLLGASRALGEAFTTTSEFINFRMRQPFAPPVWVPIRANREFRHATRVMDGTIDAMIRERRASGQDRPDLLGMLMAAADEETGLALNDEQLHNEIAVMMFAGHETTAVTLTWAAYLLSQNPAAERALHAEVDSVLNGRAPTMDDVPALRYTRAVIDETLRLYPAALGVTRQSVAADQIAGYDIPADASISLIFNNAHSDPRFWDEPDRFEPARFLSAEAQKRRPAFAYLPFGAGPRMCIGNTFALTEATLVLASLAQHFTLRLVPGHPVRPNPLFVLRTSHGLPMTLHRR